MAEADKEVKTYRGNCHCGALVFEVDLPAELKGASVCNCSLCSKKGYYWTVPLNDSFKLVKGDEKDLTMYTFNNGAYYHYFCSNCGTGLYARNSTGTLKQVVNVRALQGPVDLNSLEISHFDGAALAGNWKPAEFKGPEPEAGPVDGKTYHGSCHCGAVTFAVKIKDLDKHDATSDADRIMECNCSICQRNAYVWIYPKKEQVVIQGRENVSYYTMGSGSFTKPFCKTCGISTSNENRDMTDEEVAALSPAIRNWRVKAAAVQPVNIRLLDDFDFRKIETRKFDGYNASWSSPYVNP